jgi:peptidoglycan/xylan/chitin deacetylase (PgdA/CDA1 family)
LWKVSTKERKVYLTFDDGPTPDITSKVLDLLNRYQAQATFFCLGKNVVNHPELFGQIKSRGHQVGNHSFSHPDGWATSNPNYFADIGKADQVIQSRLFRPPYGKIGFRQYLQLKKRYTIVMWDVLSGDYNPRLSPDYCFKALERNTRLGSIIVFHDSIKAAPQMLPALEKSLAWLHQNGYSFGLIGD